MIKLNKKNINKFLRPFACYLRGSASTQAFTLLELLMVVGIIAILAAAGAGIYGNFVKNVQLDSAEKNIIFDLKNARSRAMAGESELKWGIRFVNSSDDYYELFSTPTDYASASTTVEETVFLQSGIVFTSPSSSGTSTNTASTSPSTVVDDASVGTVTWLKPGDAVSSNNVDAGASLNAGVTSHYLKATNFGFNIPASATIDGIVVEVERRDSRLLAITDNAVRIVKNGSIGTTDRSNGAAWPTIDTYVTYGSSTDLWGESWTSADINSSSTGFAISATESTALVTAEIDHIRMTVYYTAGLTDIIFNKITGMATSTYVTISSDGESKTINVSSIGSVY